MGQRRSLVGARDGIILVRPLNGAERDEVRNMRTDEIKQVVKSRYGKFAETGGKPEAC
jgi:hypothetical protein